jgi:phosphohistidine phosphatase
MALLHLFRHAKSSRDDPSLDDHDRPLAPRGREAAPLMARWMADSDVVPGLVLVSTARRTRETWTLMRPAFKPAPQVEFEEALYLASDEELLDRIRRLSDEHEEVMLIGHNPGLHDLAIHLVAGHGIEYGRLAEKYPTAALCTVDFGRKSWGRITAKSGRLARFVRPVDVHED